MECGSLTVDLINRAGPGALGFLQKVINIVIYFLFYGDTTLVFVIQSDLVQSMAFLTGRYTAHIRVISFFFFQNFFFYNKNTVLSILRSAQHFLYNESFCVCF